MNKFYTIAIAILFSLSFSGCSKESFQERIIGTWQLEDVDRVGWGGNNRDHPFKNGTFTFVESGSLTWVDPTGTNYKGTWQIRKNNISGGCNTDGNGITTCNNRQVKSLMITAIDFNNQDIRSEYFEEMDFNGNNRFKAYVEVGNKRYVFYFRRQ